MIIIQKLLFLNFQVAEDSLFTVARVRVVADCQRWDPRDSCPMATVGFCAALRRRVSRPISPGERRADGNWDWLASNIHCHSATSCRFNDNKQTNKKIIKLMKYCFFFLREGVPATLSWIPRDLPPGSSPQLRAYPSWEWHQAGKGDYNCTKLISVYRIRADRCNRLWVLDAGVTTSIDDFRPVCPPKLLVFDMQSDQLVRQYVFPREVIMKWKKKMLLYLLNNWLFFQVIRPNTLLTNLILDDTSSTTCDDVFVYMTDTTGPGIKKTT